MSRAPPRLHKVSVAEAIPSESRELWEERAALMEYDGGLARKEAEWQAFVYIQGKASAITPAATE